ncbi:MAG: hypothetical protein ACKVRN_05375 [Pyrinomonadaceae bacterium]
MELNVTTLRDEILKKRDGIIAIANADAKRALNALEIVAAMLQDESGMVNDTEFESPTLFSANGQTESGNSAPPSRPTFPTGRWITEIIEELPEIVSQPMIYDRLIALHPEVTGRPLNSIKGQIANNLTKMVNAGILILHQAASGRQPAEFRKNNGSQALSTAIRSSAADSDIMEAMHQ